MQKYHEDATTALSGHWIWSEESQNLEFVSSSETEKEDAERKQSQTEVSFKELQLRAEWLAEMCRVNHRGRQSIRKRLSSAHLNAYRSSLIKRQGQHVTMDDVKQVAVRLLQDNYLLPIPFCFLDVLKSKEFDEVLAALLLYLSCFFEHKSQEDKFASFNVTSASMDVTTKQQKVDVLAKKEIAQKKLAVRYFTLILKLEGDQHLPHCKAKTLSDKTEWLLHASLYSFYCLFAWVTFDRKHLREIQEEVGRLLYSDIFNMAVRNQTDGDSGMTLDAANGTVKAGTAAPKKTKCNRAFKQRTSLGSIVTQRSPLMVSLLPSPKERSPHLFSRAGGQSALRTGARDTETLTERLHQQLASVSFGVLGKPLSEFHRSSQQQQQKTNREDDCESGS